MSKLNKRGRRKFIFRRVVVLTVFLIFSIFLVVHIKQIKSKDNNSKINLYTKSEKIKSINNIAKSNNSTEVKNTNKTQDSSKENVKKDIPETNPNINAKYDSSFFNNTVFIGDSVTKGIEDYVMLKNVNVVANNGQTMIRFDKISGKVGQYKPKKIFILLGTNDLLNGIGSEKFVLDYESYLKVLRKEAPNAKIYIESILPVEDFVEKEKPLLANSRIDEFNLALKNMRKDSNEEFIDIASAFKNSKGCMYSGFTSEGIHLKYNYYNIWFNYLQEHAQ